MEPSDSGYIGYESESFHRKGISLDEAKVKALFTFYRPDLVVGFVDTLKEIERGFNNKVYRVEITHAGAESSSTYAIRLSNAKTWPNVKVRNEIASLQYIRRNVQFPTPTVIFASEPTNESGLHPEFGVICMEWMPGDILTELLWEKKLDSDAKRQALVEDLVSCVEQMAKLRFEKVGSVVGYDPETNTAVIGPSFEPAPEFAGPFDSISASILAQFTDFSTRLIKDHELPESEGRLAPLVEFIEPIRKVLTDSMPYFDKCPIVAVHGDFCGRNILVDPSTGRISAVLDWEWLAAWPQPYEWLRGFDDMPETLKSLVETLAEKRGIRKLPDEDTYQRIYQIFTLIDYLSPWDVHAHFTQKGFPCDVEKSVKEAVRQLKNALGEEES